MKKQTKITTLLITITLLTTITTTLTTANPTTQTNLNITQPTTLKNKQLNINGQLTLYAPLTTQNTTITTTALIIYADNSNLQNIHIQNTTEGIYISGSNNQLTNITVTGTGMLNPHNGINFGGTNPHNNTITNSTFTNAGNGIFRQYTTGTNYITNCTFIGNYDQTDGDTPSLNGSIIITNCTFINGIDHSLGGDYSDNTDNTKQSTDYEYIYENCTVISNAPYILELAPNTTKIKTINCNLQQATGQISISPNSILTNITTTPTQPTPANTNMTTQQWETFWTWLKQQQTSEHWSLYLEDKLNDWKNTFP